MLILNGIFPSDALLEDLEASIPSPITCGPKTGSGKNDEIILDMQSDINDKLVRIKAFLSICLLHLVRIFLRFVLTISPIFRFRV